MAKSAGIGLWEKTIDLTINAGNKKKYLMQFLEDVRGHDVVYLLIHKTTKEILKVGKTSNPAASVKRFGTYLTKSQEYGVEVEAVLKRVPRGLGTTVETTIRKELQGQGHALPWDRVANPKTGGLPWVTYKN